MKIFDAHIHTYGKECNKELILDNMRKAGVYGGCIFSTNPKEYEEKNSLDFDKRVEKVLEWSEKDRLFPVLWIHPYEKDIEAKLSSLKGSGIYALKIICNDFFINEDKAFSVMKTISERIDLPVFFHSGILWDGRCSSKYNRPIEFERLIELDNLRFSMGHCSWPWMDECIALYGKFLNCERAGHAEMFFDLTAGTPEIYREELLTKLFTIGYDVPDNIFFGTDCDGEKYSFKWAKKWIDKDNSIYDKLGVPDKLRQKIYESNLLRFLGITKSTKTFLRITPDGENRIDILN